VSSSLVEKVNEEMKASMKARDKARTSALRMIRAAIIEESKAGKGEVTDDKVLAILRRIKKQRLEAAEQYEAGGREDLAAGERAEADIADEFLPQLADEATTRGWVKEAIAATGVSDPKQLGRIMGVLMKGHKAELDAGLARRIIEEELS
jgi:uncharacterized protein YqeY